MPAGCGCCHGKPSLHAAPMGCAGVTTYHALRETKAVPGMRRRAVDIGLNPAARDYVSPAKSSGEPLAATPRKIPAAFRLAEALPFRGAGGASTRAENVTTAAQIASSSSIRRIGDQALAVPAAEITAAEITDRPAEGAITQVGNGLVDRLHVRDVVDVDILWRPAIGEHESGTLKQSDVMAGLSGSPVSPAAIGPAPTAAAAAAAAFCVAATSLTRLRDPDRLRPWLYSIVRYHAMRRIRDGCSPTCATWPAPALP
jgi:hypothetical protein